MLRLNQKKTVIPAKHVPAKAGAGIQHWTPASAGVTKRLSFPRKRESNTIWTSAPSFRRNKFRRCDKTINRKKQRVLLLTYIFLIGANLLVVGARVADHSENSAATLLLGSFNGIPVSFSLGTSALSPTQAAAQTKAIPGIITLGDGHDFYRKLTNEPFMQYYPCALLDFLIVEKAGRLELNAWLAKKDSGCHHLRCSLPISKKELLQTRSLRPAAAPFQVAKQVFEASITGITVRRLSVSLPLADCRSQLRQSLEKQGYTPEQTDTSDDTLFFHTGGISYLVSLYAADDKNNTDITVLEISGRQF